MENNETQNKKEIVRISPIQKAIESFLFASRWLLMPFYAGLMLALGLYAYLDIKEICHILSEIGEMTEEDGIMMILKLVDITMIANLVKMIITGSYTSFVNKFHTQPGDKSSSGVLKVKMSSSLIGVSSIHLLQTFIHAANVGMDTVWKKVIIHCAFLIGSLVLAWIDYLHVKSEMLHDDSKH